MSSINPAGAVEDAGGTCAEGTAPGTSSVALTTATTAMGTALSTSGLGFLEGATLDDIDVGTEAIYIVDKRNK